ncbi:surfeit locus 1 family protein [Sphingomonas sp. OV641]|uniref:SURF1 family cytochrome oxidase biogenesis protein n=1 Tax=Sphingomonas sp. OV641 TaxID=1881068 RepID=UPI0008C86CE6|nr:SURF1 family cytochrome oxidase biogenesis protein [Sphingomonas sp. OV641]SEJ35377.1 surfeit locus 1 family protein [Sphingomonas sp. OV641]
MKRIPVLPTILVVVAVAVMITLGLWQGLVRLPEKEAQLAQLAANPAQPPVAFPRAPDDRLLFRRSAALCREVKGISRAGAGSAGYRLIAECRTDAGGPAIKVQLGTTRDPFKEVRWTGGAVRGWISHAPDATPMISRLFRRVPQEMLLVADTPAAGLAANTRPDVGLVPNNHLAYAGQWLFFAGLAGVIYVVALRRRMGR